MSGEAAQGLRYDAATDENTRLHMSDILNSMRARVSNPSNTQRRQIEETWRFSPAVGPAECPKRLNPPTTACGERRV